MKLTSRLSLLGGIALLASACATPTSATAPLSLSCPSIPIATSQNGGPVVVTYSTPTMKNGTSTLLTTCTPQSGSAFPVGTTNVTCQSTVSDDRVASCRFGVTVQSPARLSYTRFLSFGDSITEGKVSPPLSPTLRFQLSLLDPDAQLAILESRLLVFNDKAYPYHLQLRLGSRYPQQTIRIDNDGVGAEYVSLGFESSGAARLPSSLSANNPEVLLLMEGTNDMLNASGPDTAILALEQMVNLVLGQGRKVVMATIPPTRPVGTLRFNQLQRIPGFNTRVRSLAAAKNVPVADVYAAINADVARYIGEDHLHPTELGYQVIADTFLATVRSAFEQGANTGQTPK
jgi:lysophospholipase L1-like esterase